MPGNDATKGGGRPGVSRRGGAAADRGPVGEPGAVAPAVGTLWQYPPEFVSALGQFGLAPTPVTPPVLVRDTLNALYRFELRRLRDRLLAREFEKPRYLEQVIALRRRYWPLTLPLSGWERVCRPSGSA